MLSLMVFKNGVVLFSNQISIASVITELDRKVVSTYIMLKTLDMTRKFKANGFQQNLYVILKQLLIFTVLRFSSMAYFDEPTVL